MKSGGSGENAGHKTHLHILDHESLQNKKGGGISPPFTKDPLFLNLAPICLMIARSRAALKYIVNEIYCIADIDLGIVVGIPGD